MNKKIIMFAVAIVFMFSACAKQDHWGQKLDINDSWWKKEGQSWDRKDKIFMAVGFSNPSWKEKYDLRNSADLSARSQVSTFMDSLVKNYMKEVRTTHHAISRSIVESVSNQTLLGAVIVARHFTKGKNQYESLIQVDMNYFFDQIYDKYEESLALNEDADAKIKAKAQEAILKLKEIEDPIIEKTINEGNVQGGA